MTKAKQAKPKRKLGFAPFFLGAALVGVLGVPVWVLQYLGADGPWAAFDWPYWHGHEMLFGYGFAVMGGYLLAKVSPRIVGFLFCLWLLGRAALFLPADPLMGALLAFAFPIGMFIYAGLPFFKAAKRWRSAIPGGVLAAFVLAEALFQAGRLEFLAEGRVLGLLLGIDLLAALLYLMGGRVIAAATSGAHQARGGYLPGVAQQKIEFAGLLALAVMVVCDLVGLLPAVSGAAALIAGTTVVARLWRWQVWKVVDALDVTALHIGYLFLAVGLAAKGAAQLGWEVGVFEASHGATVGALGVLSITIMGRSAIQRTGRPRDLPVVLRFAIALMIGAALARLGAFHPDFRADLLYAASALWTAALVVFAGVVARFALVPAK